MIDQSVIEKYSKNYNDYLEPIAKMLEDHIKDHLKSLPRIDRIESRPKSIRSFKTKASKIEKGKFKYSHPLIDIQDQIGLRVVCFYLSDLPLIENKVKEYYRPIEEQHKKPKIENAFDYEGTHYIVFIPDEFRNSKIPKDNCPEVFELQIKTLYQHAWAVANHDLGYKAEEELTHDQKRRIAFTSAQSWGADYIFNELFNSINNK